MIFKKRNLSSSIDAMNLTGNAALWSDWTVSKSVNEGYEASGWVYKSVNLVAKTAASVPFVVKNADNEIEWHHPLTELFLNPHPYLSRFQYFELLIQWLQLAGNAYQTTASDSRSVQELWPISPDRIAPIESKDNSIFVDGYEIKDQNGVMRKSSEYTTDNIIHLSLTNPAQPLLGISPLQAAARAVDSDVAQQNWNVAAMQNRGVVEGVFTFQKDLDKKQSDSIMERIVAKISGPLNARKHLVVGSDAKYTRLSLTAAEMDFLNSRKFNRDEIFVIYGVPAQLGGSEASATYNNFSTSMRIFWEITLIPLLTLMATQYGTFFKDILDNGRYISYDLSGVVALRENETEQAKTSKLYYEMGVPFEQINKKFELGFEPYQGWDLPFNGLVKSAGTSTPEDRSDTRSLVLIPSEKRNAKAEAAKRDKIAEGPAKDAYSSFFDRQRTSVFAAIDAGGNPIDTAKGFYDELAELNKNVIVGVASDFANTVVIDNRGQPLNFQKRGALEDQLIEAFLLEEQLILSETSLIQDSTIKIIADQVRNAADKGFNSAELRVALDDTGLFSPARALRIARTEVATAGSIGQIAGATVAGAELKTWEIGGTETRPAHVEREGEEIRMDERFSVKLGSSVGPRFPADPQISAADRINCDCFLNFRIE